METVKLTAGVFWMAKVREVKEGVSLVVTVAATVLAATHSVRGGYNSRNSLCVPDSDYSI